MKKPKTESDLRRELTGLRLKLQQSEADVARKIKDAEEIRKEMHQKEVNICGLIDQLMQRDTKTAELTKDLEEISNKQLYELRNQLDNTIQELQISKTALEAKINQEASLKSKLNVLRIEIDNFTTQKTIEIENLHNTLQEKRKTIKT